MLYGGHSPLHSHSPITIDNLFYFSESQICPQCRRVVIFPVQGCKTNIK